MAKEVRWERQGYASRIDRLADDVTVFAAAVLATIDVEGARSSPSQWRVVCGFFAGCAEAAVQQTGTASEGGRRIAEYFRAEFPSLGRPPHGSSQAGFWEFMDWLSNPEAFRPSRLSSRLTELR